MPSKFPPSITLLTITFCFISVTIETDIYVSALPNMQIFFQTTKWSIQGVVTLNFLALCFSCLIFGPLSDAIGRRPILIFGMGLFVIASLFCCSTQSLSTLLTARFFQGIGSGAPMCLGATIIFDLYDKKRATSIISWLNGIISASLAGAPILGGWLTTSFGWRSNFYLIFLFSTLSFILLLFFFPESHHCHNRKEISFKKIIYMYSTLLRQKKFLVYSLLLAFMYASLIIYISNLAFVFIQHLSIDQRTYGIHQGMIMGSFMLSSLLGGFLIRFKGINLTEKLGGLLMIVGAIFFFIIAYFFPNSPNIITLSMTIFCIGNAFCFGIFGVKAMNVIPDLKGSAYSLCTSFRLLFTSFAVFLTGMFFNGTMLNVAAFIFIFVLIGSLLIRPLMISKNDKKSVYDEFL